MLLLLGLLFSVLTALVVRVNRGLVLSAHIIDEGVHHSVVEAISLVEFIQEHLGLLHQPRQHISLQSVILELIEEEAHISKLPILISLKLCVELLRDLTGDHLFVGELLSRFLLSLQVFLSFVGLETESFLFFEALDISVLKLVQILELGLFAFNFGELLFFEHFHAGLLERLAAEHGEQWLHLVFE